MIRIHEIKLRPGQPESRLVSKAERKLGLEPGSIDAVSIVKESLDAREKPDIYRVFSLDLVSRLSDEELLAAAAKNKVKAGKASGESYVPAPCMRSFAKRPVVCGFGPCGMFAALVLAMYGAKPVVLERGASMQKRVAAVEAFWSGGKFDPKTNVQFGEGGAGTFSDGKLTTGTKDAAQRFVLEQFVEAGADPSILYKNKPHLGTDVLRRVVVAIRHKIEALGGELRFECEMTSLDIRDGRVAGLWVNGSEYIETDTVILALGHSARNTVRKLYEDGLQFEQKPFSMGVRIEHPQSMVDISQYGRRAAELKLAPADYKLAVRTAEGRGVYTFCMCPGGYVVASASFEGGIVTNGMSNSSRGGCNANSALLVDVRTSDFPDDTPLSGMALQEQYERAAFELAGSDYKAPCESVGDFLASYREAPETADGNSAGRCENAGNGMSSDESGMIFSERASRVSGAEFKQSVAEMTDLQELPRTCSATDQGQITGFAASDLPAGCSSSVLPSGFTGFEPVQPTYRPGVIRSDLRKCLPDFVCDSIAEALPMLGRKLRGFDSPDALMTAPETRSSAPFRMRRDELARAYARDGSVIEGLYPGGEGAGYAGGIMSAAADGVHLAEKCAR